MKALRKKEILSEDDIFYPESDGKPMAENTTGGKGAGWTGKGTGKTASRSGKTADWTSGWETQGTGNWPWQWI